MARKTSSPALSSATVSTVVAASAPEVVASAPAGLPRLTFIIASDKVRGNAETKVAGLVAENGLHNVRQERTFETLAAEMLRLRRMFPARPQTAEILGDDQPDLLGITSDYKLAQARVNEAAENLIVNQLRKEGFTVKLASAHAKAELERIRQSVSRAVRIAVEDEAKSIGGDDGARFLLGHGFGFSTVVSTKSNPGVIGAKSWKLVKDAETGTFELVKGEQKALDAPPVESEDQATPTETAEAIVPVATSIAENVNGATGLLRTVAGDKRLSELSVKDRLALARLIGQASFETLLAIGESLPEAEAREVALMARQVSGVIVAKLLPEVAKVAATK